MLARPYLANNLKALFEQLGAHFDYRVTNGAEWFSRVRKNYFPPEATFPARSTIANWLNPKRNNTTIQLDMLAVFMAYLKYGATSQGLPVALLEEGRTLAKDACINPDSAAFILKSQIKNPNTSSLDAKLHTSSEKITILLRTTIESIRIARDFVQHETDALNDPTQRVSYRFAQRIMQDTGAATTPIDEEVEHRCREVFETAPGLQGLVQVEGEEGLKTYKGGFQGWNRELCVLLDGVDGTSLAAMGIPLWCSAAVFFEHKDGIFRILGSVVALPYRSVCVARTDQKGAWFANSEPDPAFPTDNVTLAGHSGLTDLAEARIAFYGQKSMSFLSIADDKRFCDYLMQVEKLDRPHKNFRLYNFAGNPIIVKLVDRKRGRSPRIAEGVDVVLEKRGQYPHDFVPGAYIALKNGAYMCDLTGQTIDEIRLSAMLADPKQKFSYVVAATEELARAVCAVIEPIG